MQEAGSDRRGVAPITVSAKSQWAHHVIPPDLSLVICETRIPTPTFQVVMKIEMTMHTTVSGSREAGV